MIQIREFVRPDTLDEALAVLNGSRTASVFGGGAYLRLGKKNISTAIDLGGLGLNRIEERDDRYVIGAMCTFGELERSQPLNGSYDGLFSNALRDVVGVQFRNTVTVGGTVFSRYGFSDLIPPLLALNGTVVLHLQGRMNLEDFLQLKSTGRDILTHVEIPKACTSASFQSVRLSTGDYAALNLALARVDGLWRVAVGARPGRAALAYQTMALLNGHPWNEDLASLASESIAQELTYGTNTRGTSEYRRLIAGALLRKAIKEVEASC